MSEMVRYLDIIDIADIVAGYYGYYLLNIFLFDNFLNIEYCAFFNNWGEKGGENVGKQWIERAGDCFYFIFSFDGCVGVCRRFSENDEKNDFARESFVA